MEYVYSLVYVGITFSVVCCVAEEEPAACGANAEQPMDGDVRDSAICFPLGCFHATFLLPSR